MSAATQRIIVAAVLALLVLVPLFKAIPLRFNNIKTAKRMAAAMTAFTAFFVLLAGVLFILKFIEINSFISVEATVTDVNKPYIERLMPNSLLPDAEYETVIFPLPPDAPRWVEYSYTVDGSEYKARVYRRDFESYLGNVRTLFINPDNPYEPEFPMDYHYIFPATMLGVGGLFGIFAVIYIVNYFKLRKTIRESEICQK